MTHKVKILHKENLNHNVIQFRFEKPKGFAFVAGQATELSIDEPKQMGPNPFTFTCLNTKPYLELTIKIYPEHNGMTAQLARKQVGDSVIITDAWDTFINKGPGVFIAGGAGITPFLAILRQLKVDKNVGDSYLFFSNKTTKDIFLKDELTEILGKRYVNVLTQDPNAKKERINEAFLRDYISNYSQPFYLCGPPGFAESIQSDLTKLGAKQDLVMVSF
jgi:ferredoxin-NADP reductase